MNSGNRLKNLLNQKFKSHYRELEEAYVPSTPVEFFADGPDRDNPLFLGDEFSANDAWWLAELCRLVYEPDSKEFNRIWNANKADRLEILDDRTPFKELLDVHRKGNHASIYEISSEGTIVCFRGTSKASQWLTNLVFHSHEWERYRDENHPEGARVHSGFYVSFKSIWPDIWPTLRLAPRPWIFTGHSLGGAMAKLAHAVTKGDQVYTFGAPRLGNQAFADHYLKDVFRVVNGQDIVPLLPAKDQTKGDRKFVHGGQLTRLDESGIVDPSETEDQVENRIWDVLERWAQSDSATLFKHRPDWIKNHLMDQYCDRLTKSL